MKEKNRKAAEVMINNIFRNKLIELRADYLLSIKNNEWMMGVATDEDAKEFEADNKRLRDYIEILDEYISKFEVKKSNEDNL
jgi:hypothetical protein